MDKTSQERPHSTDEIINRVEGFIFDNAMETQAYIRREEDAFARYMGNRKKPDQNNPWPGSSDLDIGGALTLSHTESIHSRIMYALQRSWPYVQVKSKDKEEADQAQQYLRHKLETEVDIMGFSSEWIHNSLVGGLRRAIATWETEHQKIGETWTIIVPPEVQSMGEEDKLDAYQILLTDRLMRRFPDFKIHKKTENHWKVSFQREGKEYQADLKYKDLETRIEATVEWIERTFHGVKCEVILPEDCWKSPGPIQTCQYFFRRVWMRWNTIVSRVEAGIYDLDLEDIDLRSFATDPVIQVEGGSELVEQRKGAVGESTYILGHQLIEVMEAYILDDWEGNGVLEDRWFTYLRGPQKMVRNVLRSSAGYKKRPISQIIIQPVPDKPDWGLGIPTLIGSLMDEETAIHNLTMDVATMAAFPPNLYDQNIELKNDIRSVRPNTLIGVPNTSGNIASSFHTLQSRADLAGVMSLQGRIDQISQSIDGVSDTQLMEKPKSKTLGQSMLVQDEINIRFQSFFDRCVGNTNAGTGIAGLIGIIADLYQRFGDPVEIEADTGEYSEISFPNAISYTLDVRADISKINQNVKRQKAQAVLQSLLNPLLIQMGITDPAKIYHAMVKYLEALDVEDTSDLLNEPPAEKMAPVDPHKENVLLLLGKKVDVHPADNDAEHIHLHRSFLHQVKQQTPVNPAPFEEHLRAHRKQMQMKERANSQATQDAPGAGLNGGNPSLPVLDAQGTMPVHSPMTGGAPNA